MSIKLQKRGQ
jgi:integrase